MTKSDNDPSIHHEPHLRPGRHSPDPAEPLAAARLEAERARADPAEERARHSIFDELAVLPGRQPVTIEQDWYCRACGYNLRGLRTGHPCPECGVVERYEPPRPSEETYATWEAKWAAAPNRVRLALAFALSVAVVVPASAVCAFLLVEQLHLIMFCIIGPAAAELTKLAPALFMVERRGRVRWSNGCILAMALICAVVFALVQSYINLSLFHRNAPAELRAYRWTAGPVLHALCTLIAAWGLLHLPALPGRPGASTVLAKMPTTLLVAFVVHATINGIVFIRGYFGYGF